MASLTMGGDAMSAAGGTLRETGATFDPVTQETRVQEQVSSGLCVSFRLDREWRVTRNQDTTLLQAAGNDADLEIRLRSASDLQEFPEPHLADREAAALQRTYESLIGRPAHAITHQPTGLSRVSRWSAVWVDANFAGASHALEVETFIVDLKSAALELTLTNGGTQVAHVDQIKGILSSLRIGTGTECGAPNRAG